MAEHAKQGDAHVVRAVDSEEAMPAAKEGAHISDQATEVEKPVDRIAVKMLERVNPAHADIPFFPERYFKDSDYYRYYGFALSTEDIQNLAKRYVARRLNRPDERPTPKTAMMIYLLSFCKQASGWHHTQQVLVKPVPEDADSMIQDAFPSPNGQPTVIFFSIVMEEDRFESRPDQEQIDTLVRILGKEPEWREDALPKSQWMHHYGCT